ncbi:MAG: hypothetical protein FWD74_12275, partial [Actinomycetia bacterium]|nr:hypothetical protein [Actinomycetes bacterium]
MTPRVRAVLGWRLFPALLALLVPLGVTSCAGSSAPSASSGAGRGAVAQVVFTARLAGGAAPATAALNQAMGIIEQRVKDAGAKDATAALRDTGQIVVTIAGPDQVPADVVQLGQPGRLDLRPLVSPSVPAGGATAGTAAPASDADVLASLAFPIPTTDVELAALSSDQQTQLGLAMEGFDCAAQTYTADRYQYQPIVACDQLGQRAFLLGPTQVPVAQIASATALAPDTTTNLGWTISLALTSSGE